MEWKSYILEFMTGIGGTIIGSIIGFISGKRKSSAESKDIEVRVTKSIFTTYDDVIKGMHNQINEYIRRIEELDKTVQNLVKENNSLREDLSDFEKKYGKQIKTTKKLNHDAETFHNEI